ncbi:hypothetical protein TSOC_002714 [Tetrabaena socialis]|uniref:RING-type domain-containing protein n=1 Tax=Tetrabaena socialis TaxID=47790 RepID=A0A2J8ADE3_9CHLO|nr:hypothetical protein TSOC_002714 [Tetrabaena socialis]|eukprot:PNH10535.1 hypothetical protein TSOC_002714 [Tetrabaena socialis]
MATECMICFESTQVNRVMTMQCSMCNKQYHGSCMLNWYASRSSGPSSCPNCRATISIFYNFSISNSNHSPKRELPLLSMQEWLKRGVSRLPAFVLGLRQTYEMKECESVFSWTLGIWHSILSACATGIIVMRVVDMDIALVYAVFLLFSVNVMVDDSSLTKATAAKNAVLQQMMLCVTP